MRLSSHSSPNAILHVPQRPEVDKNKSSNVPHLFFFLTGNPGLIAYYERYLNLLAKNGDADHTNGFSQPDGIGSTGQEGPLTNQSVIAGFSLGGFEVDDDQASNTSDAYDDDTSTRQRNISENKMIQDLMFPPGYLRKDVYSLDDQINLCYTRVQHLCQRMQEHYNNLPHIDNTKRPSLIKVILAGHSVGAYIALEVVRLHHEQFKLDQDSTTLSLPLPKSNAVITSKAEEKTATRFEIVSTILLTPTIIDLARSSSGKVAGPLLSNIPFLPSLLQLFSSGMSLFLSRNLVERIVQKVTGMKPSGQGLKTTVSFLLSSGGVRQALHMAGDELRDMGSNKWGDEIWGAVCTDRDVETVHGDNGEESKSKTWTSPRLFFLFAEKDHWIADVTRESIVNEIDKRVGMQRANDNEKFKDMYTPVVVIEREMGLVHAWCLEQSEFVADISRQWIAKSLILQD